MNPRIGVLDSGVGGLSVLREIHRQLPGHPTIYFADQANIPYGTRSVIQIDTFVVDIARFLQDQGAQVIVVACHAASTASLYQLRERFPEIPFVGMEPAVKPAAESTHTGVIGVLTTEATANGALYRRVLDQHASHVRVFTQIAPDLVQMVEETKQNTVGNIVLRRHIDPMLKAGADQIVLACTHFPFLRDEINAIIGSQATIVDPGEAIARQVAHVWPQDVDPVPDKNHYYTTGNANRFQFSLQSLLGIDSSVLHVQLSNHSQPAQ